MTGPHTTGGSPGLDRRLGAIETALHRISASIEQIEAHLAQSPDAPPGLADLEPAPRPTASAPGFPQQRPVLQGPALQGPTPPGPSLPGPSPQGPWPQGPSPQGRPPGAPPTAPARAFAPQSPPQPARAPRPGPPPHIGALRPARRAVATSTIIAAIGGAVLLLGVVFLLVLAAQAGFFGPLARVTSALVLGVGLVALGVRANGRGPRVDGNRPGGSAGVGGGSVGDGRHSPLGSLNQGALALIGTGFATLVLTVVAASALYHYVPAPAALAGAGALGLLAMIAAARWRSDLLATLACGGVVLTAPMITRGELLVGFVVVMGLAAAVCCSEVGPIVRWVRSGLPATFLLGGMAGPFAPMEHPWVLAAALVFALVTVGVALHESFRVDPRDPMRAIPAGIALAPLLALARHEMPTLGWWLLLVTAVAAIGGSVATARLAGSRPAAETLSAVLGLAGLALASATAVGADSAGLSTVVEMLVVTGFVFAAIPARRRWMDVCVPIVAALTTIVYVGGAEPWRVLVSADSSLRSAGTTVISSLLVAVLGVALALWARRRRLGVGVRQLARASDPVVGAGIGLSVVGASVAVVTVGVLLGDAVGDARAGFFWAHLAVTTSWIAVAAVLVLTRSSWIPASRRVGYVLGALALLKLFTLDLATLPGMLRVIAFLAVGAVLLLVAVLVSRSSEPPNGPQG